MKLKLKKIRSVASLLPFVILLSAIEMGGCMTILNNIDDSGLDESSYNVCYDDLTDIATKRKDEVINNKTDALKAAVDAKDTTKTCEERKAAAVAAREKATEARDLAELIGK